MRRLQLEVLSLQRLIVEMDLKQASKQHVQELLTKEQGKGGGKAAQRQHNASAQL